MGHSQSSPLRLPVLWDLALIFLLGSVTWGLLIAPFNAHNDHQGRSLILGLTLLWLTIWACHRSEGVYRLTRTQPSTVLALAGLFVAVLWADGGWRSSFYIASYGAIGVAVVASGLRLAVLVALFLAVGYLLGLMVNGYSLVELRNLNDVDSVIANTGGYFLAALFVGGPISMSLSSGGQMFRGEGPWGQSIASFLTGLAGALTAAAVIALITGHP